MSESTEARRAGFSGEAYGWGAARRHELKTDPAVFQAVLDGEKTYELRRNDRGFAKGHELWLRETRYTGAEMAAGAPLEYTGREVMSVVTHMLTGPIYGLEAGWSILSMRPNDQLKPRRDSGVGLEAPVGREEGE